MDYDKSNIAATYNKARELTPARQRRWRDLLAAHVDRSTISLVVDLGCGTPCHSVPAALLERRRQRPLALGVARAFAREDRDRRNPFREKFVAAALDAKYRAAPLDRYVFGVFSETFVRGQRQDQPAAIVEPVEPDVARLGRAGVHVDYIGRIELDLRAVALQAAHIGVPGEIRRKAHGEAAIEFDRRDPAALAHDVREDRRVVADPRADVHDVLARLRRRRRNQHRVQRRLAVVQVALRYDADQRVLIEIDRIVARRRYITARPARHQPRPRPQERLAAHRGERRLDVRVIDVGVRQYMLGIGAPNTWSPGAYHPGGAMAATPQQVKAWVRPAGPPQQDVGAALAALSGEDLLRLRAIARLRARSLPPGGMTWSDLLHEAVLRALAGARPWPAGVPVLAFLAGVMRSLC